MSEIPVGALLGWLGAGLILALVLALVTLVVLPSAVVEDLRLRLGVHEALPERHLVPEGYSGWVIASFGIAGAPPLERDDGSLVFRYPPSGALETSTPSNHGIKRKEYLSVGPLGTVSLARRGAERRIWQELELHDASVLDDAVTNSRGRYERILFFVGTREQLEQAPPPPDPAFADLVERLRALEVLTKKRVVE